MNLQEILKLSKSFGWIWLVSDNLQAKAEEIHDQWLGESLKMAKERHNELSLIRKSIREWVESEEMFEFGKKARLRYLKKELKQAIIEYDKNKELYDEAVYDGYDDIFIKFFEKIGQGLIKKINGYKLSIDVLEGRRGANFAITEEMIERAREYPIENLLELGANRRAKCCFHNGEDWNMDIRNNFAYCYVCNTSSDSIGVYMALNGVKFRDAVLSLNRQ